jgi:glycosyltransferase involved in cell wall biosynthesis
MKVMQVLYSGLGGHGSVVTSLIDADKKKEWEHCLLFYGIEELLPAYKIFCEKNNIPYSFIKKKKGVFRPSGSEVRKVMKKYNPDVIILHSPNLILPAWLFTTGKKKKLIVVEHTSVKIKSKGETFGSFLSILLAKKIVCLSAAYRLHLKKRYSMLPVSKKTLVIPNGINLETFHPSDKPGGPTLHVGMIGRFTGQKNQSLIIEAAAKLFSQLSSAGNIHFHFAGEGETLTSVKSLVTEKKLEELIHFHGLLDENGIKDFLTTLDIYIHASYAETMCTSVMQAMACGLPVLASNIPGINNIVQEKENTLLFNNADMDALINGLLALNDKTVRERMGSNARKYAEAHFSSLVTFDKYNKLLQNI